MNENGQLKVTIPVDLLSDGSLTLSDKMIYVHLAARAWKGRVEATQEVLAEEFGLSRRGLQFCLSRLASSGWLRQDGRGAVVLTSLAKAEVAR